MKILITTDTYFPMVNGVVISTNNLYRQLKKLGHDVKILTLSDNHKSRIEGDVYYLKSRGIKIYPGARVANPFSNSITKELIEWEPDIIHSQTEFTTMIIAKIIAKKLHIPQIHTYHTMYEDYLHYVLGGKLLSKNLAAKLTSILLNSLDAVITPTKKVEEALHGYGTTANTFIIPTGIDIEKFRYSISEKEKNELLDKHKIPKEGKRIVYIGRIAKEKNIEEIITLFKKSCYDKDVNLVIVGGGPYLEVLKNLVKELDIENKVFFTGMIDISEVHKYYKLGDIFATASTSETQGLTYIEALSSGLPVICRWDSCINQLIIKGYNGYTYNNENEFNEAINKVLQDDELLKLLKDNSKKKAEDYSSESFAVKVEHVYKKVIIKALEVRMVV